jgi:hypothetical protein
VKGWEEFVEPKEAVPLLWEAKNLLKTTWGYDRVVSPDYPLNVSYAFERINAALLELGLPGRETDPSFRPKLKSPKNLNQLVPESRVASLWEEQHSSSYREALKQAADVDLRDTTKSWKAFRGILVALETAYKARYWGIESLPQPKVNIAHTGLNQIARIVGLQGLTVEGFAGFLDDLCPCGLENHLGSVRKQWGRSRSKKL